MNNMELRLLYDECNRLYFNNALRPDMEVIWSERMTSRAGTYRRKEVR